MVFNSTLASPLQTAWAERGIVVNALSDAQDGTVALGKSDSTSAATLSMDGALQGVMQRAKQEPFEPFEPSDVLGEGGKATVFLALQSSMQREEALKRLLKERFVEAGDALDGGLLEEAATRLPTCSHIDPA